MRWIPPNDVYQWSMQKKLLTCKCATLWPSAWKVQYPIEEITCENVVCMIEEFLKAIVGVYLPKIATVHNKATGDDLQYISKPTLSYKKFTTLIQHRNIILQLA